MIPVMVGGGVDRSRKKSKNPKRKGKNIKRRRDQTQDKSKVPRPELTEKKEVKKCWEEEEGRMRVMGD